MNEHLDQKLASANPISEEEAAVLIPPGVGEAMLQGITATGNGPIGWRVMAALFGGVGQARARAGFVAVLAMVVLAGVGVNALSTGRDGGSDLADPAEQVVPVESIDLNTSVPDDQNSSPISVVTPDQNQSSSNTTTPVLPEASNSASEETTVQGEPGDEQPTGTDEPSAAPEVTTVTTVTTIPRELDQTCTAQAGTLGAAISAYDRQCEQPRLDCDQVGGQWVCSSEQLGESPSGFGPAHYFGDCVAVQAELFPLVGAWRSVDDPAAAAGSYIVWDGQADAGSLEAPVDIISIKFSIGKPGNYRFAWLMRQPNGANGDESNDTWVNFPDASRFGPTDGGSYNGFANVFGFGTGTFSWGGKANQEPSQSDIAIEFSSSGSYTMQLAGRSPGHQIDRIVVYPESVNRTDATAGRCG